MYSVGVWGVTVIGVGSRHSDPISHNSISSGKDMNQTILSPAAGK